MACCTYARRNRRERLDDIPKRDSLRAVASTALQRQYQRQRSGAAFHAGDGGTQQDAQLGSSAAHCNRVVDPEHGPRKEIGPCSVIPVGMRTDLNPVDRLPPLRLARRQDLPHDAVLAVHVQAWAPEFGGRKWVLTVRDWPSQNGVFGFG